MKFKADGFISQYCSVTKTQVTINTLIYFVVPFENLPSIRYMPYLNSWKEEGAYGLRLDLSDNTKFQISTSNAGTSRIMSWKAEGY